MHAEDTESVAELTSLSTTPRMDGMLRIGTRRPQIGRPARVDVAADPTFKTVLHR
jgi:hypothetical protein